MTSTHQTLGAAEYNIEQFRRFCTGGYKQDTPEKLAGIGPEAMRESLAQITYTEKQLETIESNARWLIRGNESVPEQLRNGRALTAEDMWIIDLTKQAHTLLQAIDFILRPPVKTSGVDPLFVDIDGPALMAERGPKRIGATLPNADNSLPDGLFELVSTPPEQQAVPSTAASPFAELSAPKIA